MLHAQRHGPVIRFRLARTVLGRAVYHTAAYWVDGLMVDSGCAYSAAELLRETASLPIDQVVNTHSHEDHIGGNGLLQRERGARILAHALALPVLANPRLLALQLYRRVFWGWPDPSQGTAVGEWLDTEHHRFRVIHTPGHSPDHICLFEPERGWLFSGDAFIGGRERAARPDYEMYAVIASLKKLAALPITQLFPGSGTVRNDPGDEIRYKVAALEEFAAEVRRLRRAGLDVAAIQHRLLGGEPSITFLTHGHFRARHLIEAFLQQRPASTVAPQDG
jgi:glyoxylase-like metal-dependent hydrolase (beta-lactamase superfamily II)